MQNKSVYSPINCNFYDLLEAIATQQKRIKIEIIINDSETEIIEDQIIDFKSKKGEEFAMLNSGKVVRLDSILSVDGVTIHQPPFNTFC